MKKKKTFALMWTDDTGREQYIVELGMYAWSARSTANVREARTFPTMKNAYAYIRRRKVGMTVGTVYVVRVG
jgi:hypothetical protein